APGLFIPARIGVASESEGALSRLAAALRVGFPSTPPAWALLAHCAAGDEIACSRPLTEAPDIDCPRLDFDTATLRFRRAGAGRLPARLSKYQHPARGTTLFRLWQGTAFRDLEPDWARYLALKESARNVLCYDARHFRLAVPSSVPLPRLLARACALCSGYAPRPLVPAGRPVALPSSCAYDVYLSVPPDIAAAVAAKVGQRLLPAALEIATED